MAIEERAVMREQLLERRSRLESALPTVEDPAAIEGLLQEVDLALQRLSTGTFGICEVCHEAIEQEALRRDPLLRACLEHLTPNQRRAMEHDLELASAIQGNLLPKRELLLGGWEFVYHYQPAGMVSGDFCDVLPLQKDPSGAILFLLGDVSGKGIAASMLMAHLSAIFRSLAGLELPLDAMLSQANRLFCEGTLSALYATLVCGRAHADGRVELSNAGHVRPILAGARGLEVLDQAGLPLGLFCSASYGVQQVTLSPGDSLILCTDGVTEAKDGGDTEFGLEGLREAVEAHRAGSAKALLEGCLKGLAAFRAEGPLSDDVTLMVLRRLRDAS
jgi:sigma-B regulation protein RsbU (phosphoserine phosphatase)